MKKIILGAVFASLSFIAAAQSVTFGVQVPVQPVPYYSVPNGTVVYPAAPRYYDDRYHQRRQEERFERLERERFERERDRRFEAHRREEERRRYNDRRDRYYR